MTKFLGFNNLLVFLLFVPYLISGQSISGKVLGIDQEPIEAVQMFLIKDQKIIAAETTDSSGYYFLNTNGYKDSLKFEVLYFGETLYESTIMLNKENDVRDFTFDINNPIINNPIVIREKLLKLDEIGSPVVGVNRNTDALPAGFGDPTKELVHHPAFAVGNDNANGISYRGFDPSMTKWSIYGAEIVNPNHLSSAGSNSGYNSSVSGGVMGIPYDAISELNFYASPNSKAVTPAISGVADLDFNQDNYSYINLSLIGFEAAYSTNDKHDISIGVRYSTVGLLSDLGVDFGEEQIKYQDAFFKANLTKHLQTVHIIGSSSNRQDPIFFDYEPNFNPPARDAFFFLDYSSLFNIHGLRYKKGSLKQSLFYSRRVDDKFTFSEFEQYAIPQVANDFQNQEEKIAYSGALDFYKGRNFVLSTGVNASFQSIDNYLVFYPNTNPSTFWGDFEFYNFVPNISLQNRTDIDPNGWQYAITTKLNYNSLDHTMIPELYTAIGFKSQFQSYGISLGRMASIADYTTLILNPIFSNITHKAWKFEANYNIIFAKSNKIKTELFYYAFDALYSSQIADFFGYTPIVINYDEDFRYGAAVLYDLKFNFIEINAGHQFAISSTELTSFQHVINISKTLEIKNNKLNIAVSGLVNTYENELPLDNKYDYSRIDMRLEYVFKEKNFLTLDVQNIGDNGNTKYTHFNEGLNYFYREGALSTVPILGFKKIF